MIFLKGMRGRVECLAFAPDGRTIATGGSTNAAVSWWEPLSQRRLGMFQPSGTKRAGVHHVLFHPDGQSLLVASARPGGLRLWSLTSGKELLALSPHASTCQFAPDGSLLAAILNYSASLEIASTEVLHYFRFGGIGCWNPDTGAERPIFSDDVDDEHVAAVVAFRFSPDSATLATVSLTFGEIRSWEVASGKQRSPVALERQSGTHEPQRVLLAADLSVLAVACQKAVVLWDVTTGKIRATLSGHAQEVEDIAFSPDCRLLASVSSDGTARIWDVETGKERQALDWQIGKLYSVAFAPDGLRVAAGGKETVVIWDLDVSAT